MQKWRNCFTNRIFSRTAWSDFMEWVKEDRKIARKVDALLNDIERNGHEGIGKPEALRHDFAGYWSRRITEKDRLIYRFDDNNIYIAACKGPYD
ncbi:Txe/YoeB family addiction module toxin [Selenomonas sputigena]|uniref:Endoribonuclease YoeB n=1 Tax=Selenomonas sputigena TaxID=69823 RepID=A0ABV3X8H7_9FIRM